MNFLKRLIIVCLISSTLAGGAIMTYAQQTFKISSSVFENGEPIPTKYTCEGEDINPPLLIKNIPTGTKSLVLIVDDPDAPMGTWVHWVVFNIPPTTHLISENSVPGDQGINDFRKFIYGGPCPPSGTHRYFFKLYALDLEPFPVINATLNKKNLLSKMEGHVLAQTELMGVYAKKKK